MFAASYSGGGLIDFGAVMNPAVIHHQQQQEDGGHDDGTGGRIVAADMVVEEYNDQSGEGASEMEAPTRADHNQQVALGDSDSTVDDNTLPSTSTSTQVGVSTTQHVAPLHPLVKQHAEDQKGEEEEKRGASFVVEESSQMLDSVAIDSATGPIPLSTHDSHGHGIGSASDPMGFVIARDSSVALPILMDNKRNTDVSVEQHTTKERAEEASRQENERRRLLSLAAQPQGQTLAHSYRTPESNTGHKQTEDEERKPILKEDGSVNHKHFERNTFSLWFKCVNVEFQYMVFIAGECRMALLCAVGGFSCLLFLFTLQAQSRGYVFWCYTFAGAGPILFGALDLVLLYKYRQESKRVCIKESRSLDQEVEALQNDMNGVAAWAGSDDDDESGEDGDEDSSSSWSRRRNALSSDALGVSQYNRIIANLTVDRHPRLYMLVILMEFAAFMALLSVGLPIGILAAYQADPNSECYWIHAYDDRSTNTHCILHITPTPFLFVMLFTRGCERPRFLTHLFPLTVGVVATLWTAAPTTTVITGRTIIILITALFTIKLTWHVENTRRLVFEAAQTLMAHSREVEYREWALETFIETIVPKHLRQRIVAANGFTSLSADVSNNAIVMAIDVADTAQLTRTMLPHQAAAHLAVFGARCAGFSVAPFSPPESATQLNHIRSVGDTSIIISGLFDTVADPLVFLDFAQYLKNASSMLPIRCGIADGTLLGLPIGKLTIRYDVYGPALRDAYSYLGSSLKGCFNVGGSILRRMASTTMLRTTAGTHPVLFSAEGAPVSSQQVISVSQDASFRPPILTRHNLGDSITSVNNEVPEYINPEETGSISKHSKLSSNAEWNQVVVEELSQSVKVGLAQSLQHASQKVVDRVTFQDTLSPTKHSNAFATSNTPSSCRQTTHQRNVVQAAAEDQATNDLDNPIALDLASERTALWGFWRTFEDPKARAAEYRHRQRLNLVPFVASTRFFALLCVVMGTFNLLDKDRLGHLEPTGIVGVGLLYVGSAILLVMSIFPYIRHESERYVHLSDVVIVTLGVYIGLIGAHLTRPSMIGDNPMYFSIVVLTVHAFASLTIRRTIALQCSWTVLHVICTMSFRPLLDLGEAGYCWWAIVMFGVGMVLFQRKMERTMFKTIFLAQQVLNQVREQAEIRCALMEGSVPSQLHSKITFSTVSRFALDSWGADSCVVMHVSFFQQREGSDGAMDLLEHVVRQDTDGLRNFIEQRTEIIERAIRSCKHRTMGMINNFCGTAVLCGPIVPNSNSMKPEERQRLEMLALEDSLEITKDLLLNGSGFTVSIAVEQAVHVLRQTEFPAYDVFGPAVNLSRALLVEAPSPMVAATEKLVQFFERGELSMPNELQLKPQGENWRIRGMGTVRIRQILLKQQPNSAYGDEDGARTTAVCGGSNDEPQLMSDEGSSLANYLSQSTPSKKGY